MISRQRISSIPFLFCLACGPVALVAQEPTTTRTRYETARLAGQLSCREINESSGVAASLVRDSVFWTHNDSGDRPRLFAFEADGQHVGVWSLPLKKARDWEDMASATIDGQPMLIVADTGDNKRRYDHYQLHFLKETFPPAGEKLELIRTVRFRYEDGSRDCESVAFDTSRNEILLITKTWEPRCELHMIAWPIEQESDAVITAKKIADLTIAGATGLDIAPDGKLAAVTTYGNVYMFPREPAENWAQAFARAGRAVVVPPRKQGESICFAHDGRSLILTSEKIPTPVYRLDAAPVVD